MRDFIKRLYSVVLMGVGSQIDVTLRRKILYVNIGAVTGLGLLFFLDLAYLAVGGSPLSDVVLAHLPFYVTFGVIPWLNKRGWREWALWDLMLSATFSTLLAVGLSLGSFVYSHFYFIVFAVIPVALFHSKRIVAISFLFVLNLSIFFYIDSGGVTVDLELLSLSDSSQLLLRSINVVGAIIAYLTMIWMIEIVAERSENGLEQLSVTDALTDLPNRRYFDLAFQQEKSKCLRRGDSMVLAILDIDLFKNVNDCYGHDVGDAVLKWVSHTLLQSTRAGSVIARIGGEEFALLFPGASTQEAQEAAERMRLAIAAKPFEDAGLSIDVTISIGLAKVDLGQELGQSFKLADDALYAAKRMGRNRVVVFES
ncbi:MAG: GGDEF domain-containing protein [Sideroxydans sp.]|jgi:diguanylate cyclase (GGDEF)-like protein